MNNEVQKRITFQAEKSFNIPSFYLRTKKFLGNIITESGSAYAKYRFDYFEVSSGVRIYYRQVYVNYFSDGSFVIEGCVNYGIVGEELD